MDWMEQSRKVSWKGISDRSQGNEESHGYLCVRHAYLRASALAVPSVRNIFPGYIPLPLLPLTLDLYSDVMSAWPVGLRSACKEKS